MSEKETQTITAKDVGTVKLGPAAAKAGVTAPKLVIVATGTVSGPGEAPPAPARAVDPRRLELLARHKAIKAQLAALQVEKDKIEAELQIVDDRASLAAKLAAMTPGEMRLLQDTLAAKAQEQIDASKPK